MSNVKRLFTFLIITALIIGAVIVILNYEEWMTQADIKKIRREFETDFPRMLADRITGLPYKGELLIKEESSWEKTIHEEPCMEPELAYVWEDLYTVTLSADSSFDELLDREKHDVLQKFDSDVTRAYSEVYQQDLPSLGKYRDWWSSRLYDLSIFRSVTHIYQVQSPEHTYRPGKVRDSFLFDGKNHYIQDEITKQHIQEERDRQQKKRVTPTPTPRPKVTIIPTYSPKKETASGKTGRTDPDEAHLFDDPDDYADYYAEEFADEIGEDADEGYAEAYDHWVYWHETDD